jgi:hypothetical protein
MKNPESGDEPDHIARFRKRLRAEVRARMEGRLNRNSAEDMRMFDALFAELLQEEPIILSRAERIRLRDELLNSF